MQAVLGLIALLASTWSAEAVEGRYKIEGQNPGQAQLYQGEAIIKKSGSTNSVAWQIGFGHQVGTGIRTGSVLSVVFQAAGAAEAASSVLACFQIADDKVTTGQWAVTGGDAVGTETWRVASEGRQWSVSLAHGCKG